MDPRGREGQRYVQVVSWVRGNHNTPSGNLKSFIRACVMSIGLYGCTKDRAASRWDAAFAALAVLFEPLLRVLRSCRCGFVDLAGPTAR